MPTCCLGFTRHYFLSILPAGGLNKGFCIHPDHTGNTFRTRRRRKLSELPQGTTSPDTPLHQWRGQPGPRWSPLKCFQIHFNLNLCQTPQNILWKELKSFNYLPKATFTFWLSLSPLLLQWTPETRELLTAWITCWVCKIISLSR